jgi:tetratricopeptide (TPR) repeat protein
LNKVELNRFVGQFLTLAFCMLFFVNTASGIAGSRLEKKSKSSTDIAERYFKKGMKASVKASGQENKAAANTGSKKQSYLKNAKKHHLKAISFYNKVIKVSPNHPEARTSLGYALLKTGSYSKAITELDAALNLDSSNEKALSYRAKALTELKQYGD